MGDIKDITCGWSLGLPFVVLVCCPYKTRTNHLCHIINKMLTNVHMKIVLIDFLMKKKCATILSNDACCVYIKLAIKCHLRTLHSEESRVLFSFMD